MENSEKNTSSGEKLSCFKKDHFSMLIAPDKNSLVVGMF